MMIADIGNSEATVLVAIAAAGGAVLSAVITATVTYRITNRQVTSASTEGQVSRDHELAMAREERDQTRRLDAYVTIQRFIADWSALAERTRIDLTATFTNPPPNPVPDKVDNSSAALANLIASAKVERMFVEFNKAIISLRASYGTWETMSQALPVGTPNAAATQALERAKDGCTAVVQAGELIRQQMVAELGTRS